MKFQLKSPYKTSPEQQRVIDEIAQYIEKKERNIILLGATGTGKTFTMANVIAKLNRPALILSHNKTLAAQLYEEYQDFFPENAVKYFVSYYDYYQPEAYVPSKDLYIEKEVDINREIERLRLSSMNSIVRRRDTIVVASVSCIYNIGKPEYYENTTELIQINQEVNLTELQRKLANLQYERGDYDFMPGSFRLKGDTLEIFPPYEDFSYRIEFYGDTPEKITVMDPLTGASIDERKELEIYPAKNFVTPPETIAGILDEIRSDLEKQVKLFQKQGKELEAQRLKQRTNYDLEMLEQTGFCAGIENYSRYFDGRQTGDPPYSLLDYFPDDYLLIIDESHMTIPQVGGMYEGDRSRKQTLVEFGFRLPSALDNRPLNFEEFLERTNQMVYTSATPGDWELKRAGNKVVEQIIRPTGLLDPEVEVRPTQNQIDDVIEQVKKNVDKGQRTIITTLTKRMAEDLANYLKEMGIKVTYLHSEIDTVERIDILRELRLGVYDAVVGINLLREGLDLPEVSLVIILDADKQGFLRSDTSLIQTIGRAARHVEGRVIMYGDKLTAAMKKAISETNRRRRIQFEHNKKYGITPQSIQKKIRDAWNRQETKEEISKERLKKLPDKEIRRNIKMLEQKMYLAAKNLDYETAAELRDRIKLMKQQLG